MPKSDNKVYKSFFFNYSTLFLLAIRNIQKSENKLLAGCK